MSKHISFERVEELFHLLTEKSGGEREELLSEIHDTEPKVYDSLVSLLKADQNSNSIFGQSPMDLIEEWSHDPDLIGERIGAFELKEIIGQGAMGSVFRAERADGQFDQTVAIKLLKSQMLNSKHREFFERERQILAKLNHPGIARLYDGGFTEEGRPFFTMEWVEGQSLTDYSNSYSLSVTERLKLFLKVCSAVQFAHQSLVAHLDLKPQNILIDSSGNPKLLDFGVSKLVEETDLKDGSFTLPYASPEQIKKEEPNTTSDVYSLGIILHELLTRKHPFEEWFKDRDRLKTAIISGEKSFLDLSWQNENIHFPADLEAICQTATANELDKRYSSVDELIRDLQDYLGDYPVSARARDWRYVGLKYFQRNSKVLTSIGVAALVLISMGFYYTFEIREQRNIAQEEAERAEKITELMTDVFMAADPNVGGADTITAVNLLNSGVEDIRRNLKDNPKLYADMLARMVPIFYNLGSYEKGQSLAAEAYQINLDEEVQAEELNNSLVQVAQGYYYVGQIDTSMVLSKKAVENFLQIEELDPYYLGNSLVQYGNAVYDLGDYELADSLYKRAYDVYTEFTEVPNKDLAFTTHMVGASARGLGDLETAEKMLLEALAMKEELFEAPHLEIAYTYNYLGSVYLDKKDYESATRFIENSLEQRRSILGNYHVETLASMSNLGRSYNRLDRSEDAVLLYKTCLEVVDSLLGKSHYYYAGILGNLGNSEMHAGDYKSARIHFEESQELYRELLPEDHRLQANPYLALAKLAVKENNLQEARQLFEKGVQIRQEALPEGHFLIAQSQQALGECLMNLGDYSTAIEYLELAKESFVKSVEFENDLLAVYESLITAYLEIQDQEKAELYQREITARG